MQFSRNTLVRALLAHDEDDLAERVPTVTDEELQRIGQIAGDYAFPAEVLAPGPTSSMGTTRAISLAAVDVLEGAPRKLRRDLMQRRGPAAEEDALRRLRLFTGPPGVAAEAERRQQKPR